MSLVKSSVSSSTNEWTRQVTGDGKVYYFNSATGQSRWDKPNPNKSVAQLALEESPWKQYVDKTTGKKYYYNTDTKENTWDIPADYQVLLDRVATELKSTLIQEEKPTFAAPIMEFRTREEAEECFVDMLDELGCRPDWDWELCVKKAHQHPMYTALKSVNERKAVFEEYCKNLAAEEAEKKQKKLEEDEKILRKLFANHHEINSSTRYDTAVTIFQRNDEFLSTDHENRKSIFLKYTEELRTSEKEKARDSRRANLDKFKALLAQLPITATTTWKDCQKLYAPAFEKDSQLAQMDPMDCIISFEDHVMLLDSQFRQQRNAKLRVIRREERRQREGFRELLKELKSTSTLHIDSKWKELFPIIKDDSRFTDYLGASGSSPLELFWDELMEMEEVYRASRRLILDTIRTRNYEIHSDTKFDSFSNYFVQDFIKIDPAYVKLVFEELHYKHLNRIKEEKRYQEKKLKKKLDAFKQVLRYLSPPILPDDPWGAVRGRCLGKEFEAIEESQRIQVFEKFIRRLQVITVPN
ncbi:hypothetical protein BC833DRAFT_574955 [Globomyces pollinis-pini]|nr:hypothetical protein BC833DRAFT_574955 [Globomyces pollinis-pini]